MFADGTEAKFQRLCSAPPDLAKAIFGGPNEEESGPKDGES